MQQCRGSRRSDGDRYLLSWIPIGIQGEEATWIRRAHRPSRATAALHLGKGADWRVQPKSGQRPNGKRGCLSPTDCDCCRCAGIKNNRKVIVRYVHPRAGQLDRMRTARSIVIADELSCSGAGGGRLELQTACNTGTGRHRYRVYKIGVRVKAEFGRTEAVSERQKRCSGIIDLQRLKKRRRSEDRRSNAHGNRSHIHRSWRRAECWSSLQGRCPRRHNEQRDYDETNDRFHPHVTNLLYENYLEGRT